TPADTASAYPTWCSATKPVAIAPAIVSAPSVAPAPTAAARECPPASMIDAIVKPSGTLWRKTAMERSAPSAGPIMKPAASATPPRGGGRARRRRGTGAAPALSGGRSRRARRPRDPRPPRPSRRSGMLTWSREHSMVIAALLRRLGEILVQERLTTPDVVEEALARAKTTGERLGEALVALGAVK